MGGICCLWWSAGGGSPPEAWGPSQWQNLSSDVLQSTGITTQLKHIKRHFLGDGFVLYTCDFHALLEDLSFLTAQVFFFFLWKTLALICGRYKKNERTRNYNTHLDCKLCILLYLNLPKLCKAPHVCHLDSQLSVRITSLSLSLSQMWEKRIILMRIWRQECWTWESRKLIFCMLFSIVI